MVRQIFSAILDATAGRALLFRRNHPMDASGAGPGSSGAVGKPFFVPREVEEAVGHFRVNGSGSLEVLNARRD
jgi:hypothetical protein